MYILQSLILGAIAVTSMAVNMCPEGWSVIKSSTGQEITDECNKEVNSYRVQESELTGSALRNVTFNDMLAKETLAFVQSCDFNYIIGDKHNVFSTFKTSKFDGREAYYLQVSEKEDCDTDWKGVVNSWFKEVEGMKFSDNDRCRHMQLNSAGCSFACIGMGRNGGKGRRKRDAGKNARNLYMRMYKCNFGIVCHGPWYLEQYTYCKDVCYFS